MLKSESERIALVRTIAPLVWSLVITTLANWGLQLDQLLADSTGLDVTFVNRAMTVVLGVALWLLARFAPGLFERALMWIPVKGYAYSRPDNSLVVPAGHIKNAAPVIEDIQPTSVNHADGFVQTFLARQPSEVALRAAADQLLQAADDR